jgi:uncharacterized membrane protein
MTQYETRRPPRRLLHPGLVSIGATLLIAVFVSDFVYWQSLLFQWNNFSSWLLVAGLIFSALAGIAFVVDLIGHRIRRVAWLRFLGLTIAALLSLLNAFVHSRDAYTAVVPEGIALSFVVTLLLIAVGIGGWSLADLTSASRARSFDR